MKKSLVKLAYNPFLHGTAGTQNAGFGHPFHNYPQRQVAKKKNEMFVHALDF